MINLDITFIAEHQLDIAWDRMPRECIVTYWHIVDGRNLGCTEFRTHAIGQTDLDHNLLLGSLRKAYDHLHPESKDG